MSADTQSNRVTKSEKELSGNKMEKESGKHYFLVKFSGKTSEMQTRDVFLSLNGFGRLIKRNQYVVLPESYLEIARNAIVKTFTVDPESGNRTPTEMSNYPFDTICEASEEVYKEMLQTGNALSLEDVERIKSKAYQG